MRGISPVSDAPLRRLPSRASGDSARRYAAAAAGYLALAAVVAVALGVTALAAAQPSSLVPPSRGGFPRWLAGPLAGALAPARPAAIARDITLVLPVLALAYVVVLASASRLSTRACIGAIALVQAIFMLAPPLQLTDVFNYVLYARMAAVHGLSPYAHVPAHVPHDPAYGFATWHHLSSPYGPLFTLATLPLALLPLSVAYWTLKVVLTGASLACLRLVWVAAHDLRQAPLQAVVLVGLNPLVLLFALGGDHNDFLMVAALAAAVVLLVRRRDGASAAAVVVGAAVKLPALIALPFVLVAARAKRRAVVAAAAVAAAVGAVSIAAFGAHPPADGTQSALSNPVSVPRLLGLTPAATAATTTARAVALAVVVAALLLLVRRGLDWITAAGWAMVALVVSLSWLMPWYVLWVLPFAALSTRRSLKIAALVLTAFLLAGRLPITVHRVGALGARTRVTIALQPAAPPASSAGMTGKA